MNRSDFGRDFLSNIEISNDIKQELYENCKRGKRAGDIRFRYAGVLTALIAIAVFGCTGIGAKAYYESVAKRLEEMPQEERDDYVYDIENDTGVTISEAWSRELTDDETLRLAKLETEYHEHNVFPAEEVKRVATLSAWDGKTVCYVDEDHLLHLPDAEMTDEQLLQFIDYTVKKNYVIEEEAESYFEEEGIETESPYVDVEGITEEELTELAYKELVKLFGDGVADGWKTRVEAFKPSEANPEYGLSHDMYTIYWEQNGGSDFSTDYVVVLGMYDLKMEAVAIRGREHWATLKVYSDEEAEIRAKEDIPDVLAEIKRIYGYENPDIDWHEIYDPGDARLARYKFTFGEESVCVEWDIGGKKLTSVEIYDADEDSYEGDE